MKKKKKRRFAKSNSSSFVMRVVAAQRKNGGNPVAYFFRVFGAFFIDLFRILWLLLQGPLIIAGAALLIGGLILFFRYKDDFKAFQKSADEIVSASEPYDFRMDETAYLYDCDGNELTKLKRGSDSIYLEYVDIPKDAINAFVAVEDRTFWKNDGVDLKGVLRVALNYVLSRGDEVSGASTITQQLARTTYLTREVSLERKVKEIMVAKRLTKKYSKEEIMEFYINSANFGNAIYGLEAASRAYFGVPSEELSLAQTAYLCALPNRPTYFNPYNDPTKAIPRQRKILKDMHEQGYITSVQEERAEAEEIVITPKKDSLTAEYNYEITYAVDCAIRYLMKLDGFNFRYSWSSDEDYQAYKEAFDEEYELERTNLYSGGYRVYTSLDSDKERGLQEILDNELSFEIEQDVDTGVYAFQGAMTVIDNATGKVIAVIGGRSQDYLSETYALNRAYQSYRQPGSSIKPIAIYTPALMEGFGADSSLMDIDVKQAQTAGTDVNSLWGQAYSLENAVIHSRNGCAMYLFNQLTPKKGLGYLTEMEFERLLPSDYNLSAALGTVSVSTEEMAGAYAALGNRGVYRETTCLTSIRDQSGKELYTEPEAKQVYSEEAAEEMIRILTGVIREGTASGMEWESYTDVPAAGKTGTTNDNKDGWFCGLTPYYTVAVWVGFDNPRAWEELQGSTYPAGLWKQAQLYLNYGLPAKEFA